MPYLMGGPFLPDSATVNDALGGFGSTLTSGPAGSLSGLNFRLPYITVIAGVQTCAVSTSSSATMGGETGASYDVDMRFRGVFEKKTFTGGTNDGAYWQTGGTPANDVVNIYSITISSPFQMYYINRGSAGVSSVDFTRTVQIDAGASVTFLASSVEGQELLASGSVSGVTDPVQPYPGQWANMTVTKVVKR